MNISDIMTTNPMTILQDESLYIALEKMLQLQCHHLPVMSPQGHLIGIVSDYDCHRAISKTSEWNSHWRDDETARKVTVQSVMTPAPIVVEPNAPTHEAARLMLNNNIRCLPVMRGETLVGIVTTSDLLIAFITLSRQCQEDEIQSS